MAVPPFSVYTGFDTSTLTNALLAASSGISVSNIVLKASGQDAVNFYDGSLGALGIGSGLLLTSGTTPGTFNTVGWFGTDNSTTVFNNGDADIDAVVNTVFQTQSYDATTLEFDFTAGVTATSVSFDLVFGSDEYPEWVDQFVDCAVVMVNGVNYAYFNHDPLAPLSVVSSNLAAGYFQDNAGNVLPIEYDGVSHVLKIVAPINAGQTNHIKIGIADTGDHIYDSGIFISNFAAGNIPGSGVVSETQGTSGDDTLTGSSQAEYFDLQSGNDTVYTGAGDDIVVAGSGNDVVYGGTGADKMEGDAGDDYLDGGAEADTAIFTGNLDDYQVGLAGAYTTLTSIAEGTDTLANVEFVQFKDGLFALNGNTLNAVGTPTPAANSAGVAAISGVTMAGKTLTAITTDADGIASTAPISYLWQISVDGMNWTDTSVTTKTYLLSNADIGKQVQVIASYTDAGGNPETPVGSAVTVAKPTSGFTIDPMVISAPAGASVMDPLTTLIKNAVDFGYTPNEASLAVKSVFGIASGINLASYDAYAVLVTSPSDASAVAFLKVAAQVAMTASVSDPSGMNMMLAVMNAAATGKTLNLANATDLAAVGVDSTVDPAKGKSPLEVIQNLNKNMAEDAYDLAGIMIVWDDWAGKTDAVEQEFMGHLEKISVHINQAPTGGAIASLVNGLENTAYVVSASDLLQGFQDPEGGVLSVSSLSPDNGAVTDNGNGTFTITQADGFSGPVELSYVVSDDQGASTSASQMFVIEPVQVTPTNHAPELAGSIATLASGTEDAAYTVSAAALLQGFSDVDGDTLSVSGLVADNGSVTDNGDGTFTVTPTPNFIGTVTLSYGVTDGIDSIAATQIFTLAAPFGLTLNGTSEADSLVGGTGNDTINGAGGTDTAVYSGAISDYYISYNRPKGIATITDHRIGGEGTDSLLNIEKLQFGSQTFDLLNPEPAHPPGYLLSDSFLFDASYYLLNNPELVPSVTLGNAFADYIHTGAAQGKDPNPWFDPVYYANRWADLTPLHFDDATLFRHYNLYGIWEGRSAGAAFDRYDGNRYLTDNPDVAAYVDAYVADFLGSRTNGAIAHYVIFGADEGRVAYDLDGVQIPNVILVGTPEVV